MRTRNIS